MKAIFFTLVSFLAVLDDPFAYDRPFPPLKTPHIIDRPISLKKPQRKSTIDGKDSPEYGVASGIRKSQRKRSARKAIDNAA